jgi:hypothetical protein
VNPLKAFAQLGADIGQALAECFFPAGDPGVARAEAHRQALVDAEAERDVAEPDELRAAVRDGIRRKEYLGRYHAAGWIEPPAASARSAGVSPAAVSDSPTTPAAGRSTSAVDVIATAIQESLESLIELDPPHSRATYELVAQDVVDDLLAFVSALTKPQK